MSYQAASAAVKVTRRRVRRIGTDIGVAGACQTQSILKYSSLCSFSTAVRLDCGGPRPNRRRIRPPRIIRRSLDNEYERGRFHILRVESLAIY